MPTGSTFKGFPPLHYSCIHHNYLLWKRTHVRYANLNLSQKIHFDVILEENTASASKIIMKSTSLEEKYFVLVDAEMRCYGIKANLGDS